MSSHDTRRLSDIVTIEEEVCSANELLDEIDRAVPRNCVKFMVGGNHEARYERYMINEAARAKDKRLHKFSTWFDEYKLHKRRWSHCEYGEYYELGKIIFTHGWYSSGNHAQRHLSLWHKNVFYGHTHQFQVATGVGLDGRPILSASIGTLSKHDLSYLVGKPPVNWLNMFSYIDSRDDGSFTPHFVSIVDGKFTELGKTFSGNAL